MERVLNLKSKIINRRVLMLILLPFVAFGAYSLYQQNKVNQVYAVDPLIVTYNGGAPPDPMFEVFNMLPGDMEEKTFNVENDSPDPVDVEMTAVKTDEDKDFAGILDIEIEDLSTSTIIFSGKLQDLFDSPPINLGTFPAGSDKSFRVKVQFPTSAGNEYQNALVIFDIIWRVEIPLDDIPEECAHLAHQIVNVIEGTEGDDDIHGTHKSDLILSYGGNDIIDASSDSDCIVAGEGDDTIYAESGDDVILAGPGNDIVSSGSGNDIVYGGEGDDNITTGSGNDTVFGGPGNDTIDTGSGDDYVEGGSGNDTIAGGSDNDELYGQEGDDNIRGNSGDDFLHGGADTDDLDGDSGTDTCVAGETLNSCEL